MGGLKKSTIHRHSSHNSLRANVILTGTRHHRSSSEGSPFSEISIISSCNNDNNFMGNKVNRNQSTAKIKIQRAAESDEKENLVPSSSGSDAKSKERKLNLKERALKPSSLQLCMQLNEPNSGFGLKIWDPVDSEASNSVNIWDYSDSEAAPASSWSTLPNRALLCRPLPVDIGRCTCIIVKEASPEGFGFGTLYSLYTNEGQGRQNRKLAVAYHKRRNGRSVFVVAQNLKGALCSSDDGFLGAVKANLVGSRYNICEQVSSPSNPTKQTKQLQAVVAFMPTITTWTGSYRSMRVWIPKNQSVQPKNTIQIKHVKGLHEDWEGKTDKAHILQSKVPQYNKISKQYELDFRERGRGGLRIQTSVKNFQLTMEGNGKQTILQMGRVGKSTYLLDYRHPLAGFHAFCICLAAIDSKLCCTL
ncbi:hypothetical protein Nepgr_005730 [Nepenthes gracilis]|uniref:Tubby C-terminal domain-containing protein n=1 Tax=Nepenthes gracilis TaxID=150966 RepID=A0AAD3S447_NEPGR|nr:hypothetical protein Nepgr_005730 [Nepenthes gracilis]